MTRTWAYALVPLVLLAVLIGAIVALDPLAPLREGVPPVEDLTIERVLLTANPRELIVTLVNGGPETVTVAQTLVDDAFWPHEIDPGPQIGPLGSAVVRIPYPWVEGELHELAVLTSTGLTFRHTIEVAVATPLPDGGTLARLALLGAAVGLFPVAIGLAWYPFVRSRRPAVVNALLAFSGGVLAFLALDATTEALAIAPDLPTAFGGTAVFATAAVLAVAVLVGAGRVLRRRAGTPGGVSVAAFIALGIGLHNLGEGLAIGAAYSLGEVALTSLLVVGFAVHNSTEGLAIVTPLAADRARLGLLVALGLVAGAPTIAGAWLGALAFSPTLAVAFLGLGGGAIATVLWEIGQLVGRRGGLGQAGVVLGLAAGVVVMYLTALLVAA